MDEKKLGVDWDEVRRIARAGVMQFYGECPIPPLAANVATGVRCVLKTNHCYECQFGFAWRVVSPCPPKNGHSHVRKGSLVFTTPDEQPDIDVLLDRLMVKLRELLWAVLKLDGTPIWEESGGIAWEWDGEDRVKVSGWGESKSLRVNRELRRAGSEEECVMVDGQVWRRVR